MSRWSRARSNVLPAVFLGLGSCVLYVATTAPSVAVLFDDTLEFSVVIPTLGIAHPSGYPLYTLLGKLFTLLLPWRDPAGRLNLFSAVAAALAVACYYLAAQRWARQRVPAAVVAIVIAISPAWWSQATIAEVYALHGLLLAIFLYLMLGWEEATLTRRRTADRWLSGAALVMGLGLTHHRMLALILPAALVFIAWTDPAILRQPSRWIRPLVFGVVPLLLYLYLPVRGRSITSLDGTFIPTLQGTLDWILARGYSIFFTGNPFNVHRDAASFYQLFDDQFGWLFMMAAVFGLLTAWRFGRRRYVFLLLATLAQVAFGVAYKVEDIQVFFIPAFMLAGLWAASCLVVLLDSAQTYLAATAGRSGWPARSRPWVLGGATIAVVCLFLVLPVQRAVAAYKEQDRSRAWQIYDYGEDMLAHVVPGGRVVGLGGEITLLRYFRDVLRQRPDLQVTRADGEAQRRQAVDQALAEGAPVYLTRDLAGAASRYSLHGAGPLIRVDVKAKPQSAPAGGQPIGAGVVLVEAQPEVRQTHTGRMLRLNLTWAATAPITESLKVSARLLNAAGEQVAAKDGVPVNFTYPTTAWVPGERVRDVYDLALPAGGAPAAYRSLLILYRASDGSEVGRIELPPVDF